MPTPKKQRVPITRSTAGLSARGVSKSRVVSGVYPGNSIVARPVHARLVFLTRTSSAPLVELEKETIPTDKAALELAQVRIRI